MIRSAVCLIVTAACLEGAAPPPGAIDANALFFQGPRPAAALSDWTPAPGRTLVSFQTSDGTLRGFRYAAATETAPTILAFAGNGYSIASVDAIVRGLVAQGANVVEYDYPGYGFSDGNPDMFAIEDDAVALYDATSKANGSAPLVVFGYSLGTAFASYVASQRRVRGLVLIAPMSSMADEYAFLGGQTEAVPFAPDAVTLDEADFVARSRAPLLVVHGEADRVISIAEGRKVFAASAAPQKTFVPIPGASHEMLQRAAVLDALKTFLASLPRGTSLGD